MVTKHKKAGLHFFI